MKVYSTKHLFEKGIEEVDADETSNPDILEVLFKNEKYGTLFIQHYFLFEEGKQWHRTREDAVKRAEVLRVKESSKLWKKLKKINSMVF
jgi:hypothetical protein